MTQQRQMFGGDWTEEKLDILREYLRVYTTALKKQPFELIYIDAFAGTGYRELKAEGAEGALLFPELVKQESIEYVEGSARIALKVQQPFHRYIFIEKDEQHFKELGRLKQEFPDLSERIELVNEDCNTYLQRYCRSSGWGRRRGVLFLDPFGMQVEWATLEAIAATKTLDVWVLFPLSAVNRLLVKDGVIPIGWQTRLDALFGSAGWRDKFYEIRRPTPLFSEVRRPKKRATWDSITDYYLERLKSVFPGVHDNPRKLPKKGRPLFLFCFVMCNPKRTAMDLALKIARGILEKKQSGRTI